MNHQVDILLSTYNGEVFLNEQLESIANQTYTYWNLVVRDDGSKDSTKDIIKTFSERFKEKVRIIQDEKGNLGSSLGFLELLNYVESDYIMMCDQDDIWLSNKIEVSLKHIKETEIEFKDTPILIATDLMVISENNDHILIESFWESRKDDPIIFSNYQNLIAQSVLSGCAMIFNKRCIENIPLNTGYIKYFQHDQWISINIGYYGKVRFIKVSLTKYRQHRNNAVGYYNFSIAYLIRRIIKINRFIKGIFALKSKSNISFSILYVLYFKIKYNIIKLTK